jgi:small subunit ribosomal protein S2
MKELLEAGVHFGHQTRRWNPKMKPYIFGKRNGIHIVDLQKTLQHFEEAAEFIRDVAASGRNILFVGTKRQAQDSIREEAHRCGMFFMNHRWLGGTMTNFRTIRKSVDRLKDIEANLNNEDSNLTKKERIRLERQRKKMERALGGIRDMEDLPDALFVIDTVHEHIAIKEANRLGIPVVAIVDTNCDPEEVDFPIPGNDDAIRAIRLFTSRIAENVLEGLNLADERFVGSAGAEEAGGEEAEVEAAIEATEAPAPEVQAPEAEAASDQAEKAEVEAEEAPAPEKAEAAPGKEKEETPEEPKKAKPKAKKEPVKTIKKSAKPAAKKTKAAKASEEKTAEPEKTADAPDEKETPPEA